MELQTSKEKDVKKKKKSLSKHVEVSPSEL